MTDFRYVYRWNEGDRKGQACRVLARSRRMPAQPVDPGIVIVGTPPAPKNFNSILLEFEDGHRTITSGNAIKRNTK